MTVNRVILIGRPTRDPELRYTASGAAVASFCLAVDRPFKNGNGEKETDFINIVAWNKLGQSCAEYLQKGSLAVLEGRLQLRSYEDNNGIKRIAAEVIADNVRFLTPKGGSISNKDIDDLAESVANGSFPDEDVPF